MKHTIVAATQNKHKIVEIEAITKEFGMDIISRDEAGVPDIEIVEDGTTFEENSYKKAYEIMKLCGKITIADDSGLEVDALTARREFTLHALQEKTETTKQITGN